MTIGGEGDLELGADAISARDQDRVAKSGGGEIEQTTIATDLRVGAGAGRGPGKRSNGFDQSSAGGNVHTGVFVGITVSGNGGPRSRPDSSI
jgi:hypothetical protein